MTESMQVEVERRGGVVVLATQGYINNQGGEEIARIAYELLDAEETQLLLDLEGTRIVNSIGISILIEIIERVLAVDGRLAFCNLTPTIQKTFQIMGLTQYAQIYPDVDAAVSAFGE